MKKIDPANKLLDIVMFDEASNVQFGARLFKVHYPKLTFMCGVEHTVSFFFNGVSKMTIFHQIISSHKVIYNIFGFVIYHKPNYIFKSNYQELHNKNIGVFSGNDTETTRYFMGMHRYLVMRKVLQSIISFKEFNSIPTNKISAKSVRYIHNNKL